MTPDIACKRHEHALAIFAPLDWYPNCRVEESCSYGVASLTCAFLLVGRSAEASPSWPLAAMKPRSLSAQPLKLSIEPSCSFPAACPGGCCFACASSFLFLFACHRSTDSRILGLFPSQRFVTICHKCTRVKTSIQQIFWDGATQRNQPQSISILTS